MIATKKRYKIGDKVVFYRKPTDDELLGNNIKGYSLCWFNEINYNVGKEGVILQIYIDDESKKPKYNVSFDQRLISYTYPDFLIISKEEYRKFKLQRLINEI